MRHIIVLILISVILSACESGSDSDSNDATVNGLSLPKVINLAAPDDSAATQMLNAQSTAAGGGISAANFNDADTDYTNDPVVRYSSANDLFELEMANTYLCILDKLNVTEMVNRGAYIAKLSDDVCDQGGDEDENNASIGRVIEITVLSTRLDNQSPHVVKMWIPFSDSEFASSAPGAIQPTSLLEVIIKEGVSEQKPFAIFDFNYKIIVDASKFGGVAGEAVSYVLGNFKVFENTQSMPQFEFVYKSGSSLDARVTDMDMEWSNVVQLFDRSGEQGQAKSRFYYDGFGYSSETIEAASFNKQHLMWVQDFVSETKSVENSNSETTTSQFSNSQCLSRTEFVKEVWDYNLYHTDDSAFRSRAVSSGQRVEFDTYFSFRYEGQPGSAGDWGYWLENDARLPDQAVVTRTLNGESYTVHISPGVLTQIDGSIQPSKYKRVHATHSDVFASPAQEIALECYSNCPIGGATQEMINNAVSVSELYHNNGVASETPYSYSVAIDGYKIVLKDDTQGGAVVDFTALDLSPVSSISYIDSGTLYPQGTDPGVSNVVTYSWKSGSVSYAHLAEFVDSSNQVVQLESALEFDFLHDAASERYNSEPNTNPYIGEYLNLTYYGAGQLWGFPSYEFTPGTFTQVSLNDGVILENEEGAFAVKAVGIMQRLAEKDVSECAVLDATAVLNDPNFQLPSTDNLIDVSFTVDDKPVVDR